MPRRTPDHQQGTAPPATPAQGWPDLARPVQAAESHGTWSAWPPKQTPIRTAIQRNRVVPPFASGRTPGRLPSPHARQTHRRGLCCGFHPAARRLLQPEPRTGRRQSPATRAAAGLPGCPGCPGGSPASGCPGRLHPVPPVLLRPPATRRSLSDLVAVAPSTAELVATAHPAGPTARTAASGSHPLAEALRRWGPLPGHWPPASRSTASRGTGRPDHRDTPGHRSGGPPPDPTPHRSLTPRAWDELRSRPPRAPHAPPPRCCKLTPSATQVAGTRS